MNSNKLLILFICIFILIQITSGTTMFFSKIGYQPSMWYEYYYGSEEASRYFPIKETFKEPLTIQGRIKVLYSHLFAYGIFIFFITHLLRSLNNNRINKKKMDYFCLLFLVIGSLEILLDFLMVLIQNLNFYIKLIFLYFRFFAFLSFVVFGVISIFLFLYFLMIQQPDYKKI